MLTHSLADTLLIAGFGLLLALVLDGLARFPTPWRKLWLAPGLMLGRIADSIERRLNRRRDSHTLRGRGVWLTALLLGMAAGLGFGITLLARDLGRYGVALEILVAAWCFAGAGPLVAAAALRHNADKARMETLQSIALPYVPKDALMQDRYGIVRAMIQTLAQGLRDRFLAPLLGALLFGLPGLLAMRLAALLALRWSRPPLAGQPRAAAFSASVRSLWNVAGLPASVFAATSLALTTLLVPGLRIGAAWRAWWMQARGTEGAVAVMASALHLQLGGPRLGRPEQTWLGEGSPKPTPIALRHAGWLFEASRWAWAVLLIFAALRFLP